MESLIAILLIGIGCTLAVLVFGPNDKDEE